MGLTQQIEVTPFSAQVPQTLDVVEYSTPIIAPDWEYLELWLDVDIGDWGEVWIGPYVLDDDGNQKQMRNCKHARIMFKCTTSLLGTVAVGSANIKAAGTSLPVPGSPWGLWLMPTVSSGASKGTVTAHVTGFNLGRIGPQGLS